MAGIRFKDKALTTLFSSINDSATIMQVAAGKGDNFPAVTGGSGDYFIVTMENASGDIELIKVSHRAVGSDVMGSVAFPNERSWGVAAARAWNVGDAVDCRLPAEVLQLILNAQEQLDAHIADPSAVHAASAINYLGASGISATDVEGALDELDAEKAPLASPTLTGVPLAPTQATADNSTRIATTAYVQANVALIAASGSAKKWDGSTRTVGTADPAGGVDGDIHFKHAP